VLVTAGYALMGTVTKLNLSRPDQLGRAGNAGEAADSVGTLGGLRSASFDRSRVLRGMVILLRAVRCFEI
jgi:hypothetical protein